MRQIKFISGQLTITITTYEFVKILIEFFL